MYGVLTRLRSWLRNDVDRLDLDINDVDHYVNSLLEPVLQNAVTKWGGGIRVSIAPVEFVHGRNRKRANISGSWGTFVSMYILREAVLDPNKINMLGT